MNAQMLSPFRYPGGKSWLLPCIRSWLATIDPKPVEFVEPFAGGGIVSLTVAAEHLADHVTMVEMDRRVAAVWRTILRGHWKWLADRLETFELTIDNIESVLSSKPRSLREQAFQTIVKNRVSRGGILAPGAGILRNGENGKGIKSRWYPETLRRRLMAIAGMRNRIAFIEGDGMQVLREKRDQAQAVFFLDPPYTAGSKRPGTRLYTLSDICPEEVFVAASLLSGDFLITYEDNPEIRQIAQRHGFVTRGVAMQTTHHAKTMELIISRNLDWMQ
jgi:DNA adenine methylase